MVAVLAVGYILITALIIFNVEPDTYNDFFDAIYWATVSLTTVGYGDIYAVSDVGKVITMVEIREYLAKKYNAEFTCPLTAGIFISLASKASEERDDNKIAFWRTLKKDGELNPNFPGGIEYQKEMLEKEGHTFTVRGRKNLRYFVENYEDKLFDLE